MIQGKENARQGTVSSRALIGKEISWLFLSRNSEAAIEAGAGEQRWEMW